MKLGILAASAGWHVRDLQRAASQLELEVEIVDWRRLSARAGGDGGERFRGQGRDLAAFDSLLVRAMPRGSLEQVVYRMDVLQRLEANGVPVINRPRALEAAIDKYLCLARLEGAGLPVPPTAVAETSTDALAAYEELGGDVVIKPLFGSEGRGVERLARRAAAEARLGEVEGRGEVLYLQRFLESAGHDLRVLVIGGEPAWCMRRVAAEGFVTNIARGGRAQKAEISSELASLARRAAACIGAEVAGVDILPDRAGKLWLLEVNAVPGWRALAAACGVDAAAAVLKYVRSRRGGG